MLGLELGEHAAVGSSEGPFPCVPLLTRVAALAHWKTSYLAPRRRATASASLVFGALDGRE